MKLKKLVLSGFKSFADRTEFVFDDGVTCVVGPNGCGKSNLVDAVRWVLGEQSAKSLRGSDMADVIFNGSANRRGAGCAEVTLVFDNSSGALGRNGQSGSPGDGLVSVGRRLYRSGVSEYLVNKTPCRLKDIREMFMDTGIGTDAYSIIEQGKVEVFLQGSQDDRRAVFDEAAGISKYKARKKEALRKLEHVEQDLLRLGDIVGEVEKRLRSIKYQAARARSYQEHSQRLKELRTLSLLSQYHRLSLQRVELQRRLDACKDGLSAVQTRIDQLMASDSASEVELVDLEKESRQLQARLAAVGGQLVTRQERIELLTAREAELAQLILVGASRCEGLEAKVASAAEERLAREAERARLDAQIDDLARRGQALRQEHADGEGRLSQLQGRLEDEKSGIVELMQRTSELHNEIRSQGQRRDTLHGQKTRLDGRAGEIAQTLESILAERAATLLRQDDVARVLQSTTEALEQTRRDAKELAARRQTLGQELAAAREERAALAARVETLREMQGRHEGVADAVRRVLAARQEGRLPALLGMLGDFLQSDAPHAATVEAALAGADQYLIAPRFDELCASAGALRELLGASGSAEAIALDHLDPLRQDFDLLNEDHGGLRGLTRVMDYVRCDAAVAPVAWRLLGRTFVTDTLEQAVRAAASAPAGCRFVTREGDVLEADGRLCLGAARHAAGVITRQSQLFQLGEELARLDPRIEDLQGRCESARQEQEHLDELQQKIRTAVYEATTERMECQGRLAALGEQIAALERERPLIAEDLKNLQAEIEHTLHVEDRAKTQAEETAARSQERQRAIDLLNGEIVSARADQARRMEALTQMQVSLAQAQEKKRSLQAAIEGLLHQGQQLERDLAAARAEMDSARQRRRESQEAIAMARQEADQLFADKTALDREAAEAEESRHGLQEKIQQIRQELAQRRAEAGKANEELNARRLELGELDVRVENVITRAAEEMQLDLLAAVPSYRHDEQRDWSAVEAEIQDLRGKIERLGNVNLDAISEQEELTQRQEFLAAQLTDVKNSRDQLHDLIRRINKESREMFLKTFAVIRENFQDIFRKLFGGGRSDVFLLDENDVLESGIEIVARPPGKELRSLSLLSGGEKAMTAVALLFAIFRSRPSPFCILDEVDAALDEANNERFNSLVGEFMSASQFLVISHSKRTMSMASVLYGVTMKEPGVSGRISVRFEDVGHKLHAEPAEVGA